MPWSRSGTDPKRRPAWLTAQPFAHRGLHDAGRIENSRAAFEAAIKAGCGIELDVRASRCGTPFVFHDLGLERLCEAKGNVDALDRATLAGIRFKRSSETIPTLEEVLALAGARTPLLIEIKSERRPDPRLCAAVASALEAFGGSAAIMAFDPRLLRWFAARAPDVLRGLVVSEQGRRNIRGLLARRLAIMLGRPDFLAYDIRSLPSPFAAQARKRGLPILGWTVRDAQDRAKAALHADQIIHELPAELRPARLPKTGAVT